jgi:hypothetical protein
MEQALRADPVWVAEQLANHQASAGLEHACELAQRSVLVGYLRGEPQEMTDELMSAVARLMRRG